jgi:hypothetical protein
LAVAFGNISCALSFAMVGFRLLSFSVQLLEFLALGQIGTQPLFPEADLV